ncbi:MAG: transporter [wastewater metagenome]|nr:transporter [Candidatus Loosdrechtia aerotolerans]
MKILATIYILILVFSLHATDALAQIASGLHNPVFSASALAQGNAFLARADDASAIAFNPAGLTQLQRPEVSLGAGLIYPTVEYHGINANEGVDENMDTTINTIPNIFFASPIIKDTLAIGLGVTAPYGLNGKWDEDGFSRFVVTDFDLKIITINPTLTYKPFSFLSIGAGLDYYYAETELESRVPPEGFRDLDMHGDAFGYNIGILYTISQSHSIGFSFRSKADIDFDGDLKLSNLSDPVTALDSKIKTTATLPEMLSLGYAYKFKNLWSIEADVQWTHWSRFDVLRFTTDPPLGDIEDVRNWDNTWGFALGGEYTLSENLRVRGGYAFHESPVPAETFEPSVPQSSRHALFTGFGYSWGKNLNKWIDIAYGIVFYENRTIDNSAGENIPGETIDGRYDLLTHILAINFNYRF